MHIPEKNAVGIPLEELKEDSGDTGGELMLRLPSDPIATKYEANVCTYNMQTADVTHNYTFLSFDIGIKNVPDFVWRCVMWMQPCIYVVST